MRELPYFVLLTLFLSSIARAQVLYQYTVGNHVHFPSVDFSSRILDADERTTVECEAGQKCKLCSNWYKAGDPCATRQELAVIQCNTDLNVVEIQDNAFYVCRHGKLELEFCPSGSIFQQQRGCFNPTKHAFRQAAAPAFPGSGRVGDMCAFNTDCLSGMYCAGGQCTCLSTFILREGYCYEKINPNQPGCTYDVQCSAVWPEAKCSVDSGIGTCRCPENTHVARETRDGWVCVSLKDHSAEENAALYFICPLPEGAGFKIALNDPEPQFGSFPVGCTVGSSVQSEPVAGLHGGAACIWPSSGEYVGDIYDCLHTSPQVNLQQQFPQSNYAPSADGVCCPSRALACIQPQMTGPNPSEPRWWYNSVTGTCQQFLWDPSATMAKHHSANNFRTIDHCESYCRDTCARGSPQYSVEAHVYLERPITGCSNSISCGNDFQCTSIGSQHLCCPTAAGICSQRGGRPMDLNPRASVFHPGFLTSTGKESVRFYYDPMTGKCADFTYKGAGGNFNNFLSKHECEMFCARLQCDRGTPLRIGEDSQRCQSNAGCPSSHECKTDQGVCCPRKQTICSQPLRVGDCTENVKRYWYNAATRQCQMFEYTGCQGNDNNFDNVLDCQSFCKNAIPEPRCVQGQAYRDTYGNFVQCAHGITKCPANYECYFDGSQWGCCPTKSYTCSLNSDSGIQCGAGSTFKYHYNAHTQSCETFQYNGCDGNSNNFASRENCEEYCGVGGCPNGGLPLRDHSGQMITCSSQESCPSTHECTSVFVTMSTINRCCPTKAHVCSLPPLQGSSCGSHPLTRYYFNIVTAQCSSFQYNGCDGNQNNFVSHSQCNNFCMSSACPAGTTVYMDPNDNKPILCNESLKNSCPPNYECTFNGLLNNYVCCGSGDMGVCPDGERAFVNSADHSAKECMINVEGSCPSNYLCRFNLQRNKYYCCASVKGFTCPAGKFLYRESRSGNPMRCTVGKEQCPDGYSCQSYLKNAFQGFCCSANVICPDNGEFLVDEASHQPRICTMGAFVSCPNGYVCRSAQSSNEGFCCRGSTVSVNDGCPPGNFVYMVKNEIAKCDPFNPPNAPCPSGYTCQWSTANQRYQCCGSKALPQPERKKDGCPNDQIAFLDQEAVRTCSAGGKTCPIGYFCQFSAINNQFQCCGVSAGCPNDNVAFIGMKGEPEKCVMGQSNCPFGYSCQKSHAGHSLCCTSKLTAEDCTEGEVLVDGECLKRASPNGNCTSSAQCMGGSICSGDVCKCPEATRLVGKFCQITPTCMENQILMGAMCHNKVRLGEDCKYKEQCPEGSTCENGRCSCPKGQIEKNGKCLEKPSKPESSKVVSRPKSLISKCLNPAMVAFRDFITDRIQFCSPSGKPCPPGFTCQMNAIKQQYICCGPPGARKIVAPLSSRKGAGNTQNVCPTGRIPYLLNGLPQKCTKSRCAHGYQCVFSGRDYFCCSVSINMAQISGGEEGGHCSRGVPLIFPQTKTPVSCAPMRKACPRGYMCEQSMKTRNYLCCSVRLLDDQRRNGCPGDFVQVVRIENNESVTRCERTCPPSEVAIGGICQTQAE